MKVKGSYFTRLVAMRSPRNGCVQPFALNAINPAQTDEGTLSSGERPAPIEMSCSLRCIEGQTPYRNTTLYACVMSIAAGQGPWPPEKRSWTRMIPGRVLQDDRGGKCGGVQSSRSRPGPGQVLRWAFSEGNFGLPITPEPWLVTEGLAGWICHVIAAMTVYRKVGELESEDFRG